MQLVPLNALMNFVYLLRCLYVKIQFKSLFCGTKFDFFFNLHVILWMKNFQKKSILLRILVTTSDKRDIQLLGNFKADFIQMFTFVASSSSDLFSRFIIYLKELLRFIQKVKLIWNFSIHSIFSNFKAKSIERWYHRNQ